MSYTNLRNRTLKFYKGGKIPKHDEGAAIQFLILNGMSEEEATAKAAEFKSSGTWDEDAFQQYKETAYPTTQNETETTVRTPSEESTAFAKLQEDLLVQLREKDKEAIKGLILSKGPGMAVLGALALDEALMGDKNFGAQSLAIDSAVHGASSALMKSGNPYAMAAGAALEGANFLTKAGGQTVQGFDVDIQGSGYGNLGHMESSSSRDFGAAIGLGGLFGLKSLQRKLERRNELARMAIAAGNISLDQSFELEARMNSILNTITNNLIALSGGIGLNSLGA